MADLNARAYCTCTQAIIYALIGGCSLPVRHSWLTTLNSISICGFSYLRVYNVFQPWLTLLRIAMSLHTERKLGAEGVVQG